MPLLRHPTNAPSPVHVTARLAISPAGAVELASALNTMLKTLSERQQQSDGAQAGCKALWQREIQSVIVRRGPLAAAGREAAPVIT
jgi:hypothetical protein